MLRTRFVVAVFALATVLSLGSYRVSAQTTTTGEILGTVTDPSGAVIPEAKITLTDLAKGTRESAKSNKDGVYHFPLLSPGPYLVSVAAPGFQNENRRLNVALGQVTDGSFRLSVGTSQQTITVTEAAPLVQTENGDTATAVSQQQVANVPNPGNDLSAIAQLAPGAIMNTQGGMGNVEAFGLPATSNLFTLNGMDDNDPFLNLNNSGASNLLLGSNEIQEADVVTNGYSSTYGTFSGINVNYITKSGGNEFHGNAVYYWNGRAMNANDWFSKANGEPRPFDNANQWAASVGGPIKRDKVFFFLNTEGLRVLIPVPKTITVPTPAFEAAVVKNLTNLGDTASVPYYCQNMSGVCPGISAASGSGDGIFNLFAGAKNQAFAQNNLPAGSNSIVTGTKPNQVTHTIVTGNGCSDALLAGFFTDTPSSGSPFAGSVATPAACALSVREVPINFAPEQQIAGRADWNIGDNDRAYLRVQYDTGLQPTATDPVNPIFNAQSNQPEWQGQLNETHTFNGTTTNQFLLASTWYTAIFEPANLGATLSAFPTTLQLGDGSLTNIGGTDNVWPQGRNVTQFQINDDVSKIVANHTLKFGATLHKNYVSDHDFGLFSSGLEIPFSLADFANGGDTTNPACATATNVNANVNCLATLGSEMIKNYPATLNAPVHLYEVAAYIQDEWHVRSNLTITPGLRLEHASNPYCMRDCFAELGVPLADIGTVAPYDKLIDTPRGTALLGYQNLQWEPRFGFAWQPFGAATSGMKSGLVVRGGAGIFFDIFPGQVADTMAQNPPLDSGFAIATSSSCAAYLSPNQTPGQNLFDCANAANTALQTAFHAGASSLSLVPGITFSAPKVYAPQYQKWSLEIQKSFGANDAIDIGYFGNHGIHEPVFNNSLNAFGFASLPATALTSQFGELTEIESAGISNYNGLTLSFKHNFSGRGGSGVLQLNYTYSRAMDLVSNGGFNSFDGGSLLNFEEPYNAQLNYGPADYDARHVLNGNYVWNIPVRSALFGHGWGPLVDGWQVSGAVFYRTGFPYTIFDGAEDSLLNANNYFATIWPDPLQALNRNCGGDAHAGPAAVPCYTVSKGATVGDFPAPRSETTFGAAGLRNAFRGPNYFDTDFSFVKKTKIPHWERGELQVGLQFFNLFNHYNFSLPVADISNPLFGTIQSGVFPPTSILGSFLGGDASPRLIQVKAQFLF
jgi:hypothetical protein